MCGIFGIFGINDKNFLRKATRSMNHRGPDSEGYYTDDKLMLGVRRLRVIDLEKGDQPIYNEDESIVAVHNGEIYNYKELREKLEKKGHKFKTESDTEVIVHAYEEYGKKFVSKLNGMFAFAIWDSNIKKLYIYRDRYGIKPVYYFYDKNVLLFASEIKAILKFDFQPTLHEKILPFYFKYRYIKAPDTFIRQIKKLSPGHFIEFSEGKFNIKRYYVPKLDEQPETDVLYKQLLNLLESSVKYRLESDVPLGIFISGGLDSNTILYFAKKYKKNINTFTIGFNDETDEFEQARASAEYFGTNHHELHSSAQDVIKSFPSVIEHLEEPIADATSVSTYLLSQFARNKVKTVLTGEGADELFGGYVYYKNIGYYNLIKEIPNKKILTNLVKILPLKILNSFYDYPSGIGEEGKKRIIHLLNNNLAEIFVFDEFIKLYSDEEVRKMLGYTRQSYFYKTNFSIYKTIFYNDVKYWLPNYILARLDKMAMAKSLESRVPFLDYRIVDYVSKKKIQNSKQTLRKCMLPYLPKKFIKRRKFPFYIPINKWMKTELKDYSLNLFQESKLIEDKILQKDFLTKIFTGYGSSELINSRKIWSFMVLESCYDKFIFD